MHLYVPLNQTLDIARNDILYVKRIVLETPDMVILKISDNNLSMLIPTSLNTL